MTCKDRCGYQNSSQSSSYGQTIDFVAQAHSQISFPRNHPLPGRLRLPFVTPLAALVHSLRYQLLDLAYSFIVLVNEVNQLGVGKVLCLLSDQRLSNRSQVNFLA